MCARCRLSLTVHERLMIWAGTGTVSLVSTVKLTDTKCIVLNYKW